jgi:hypothetical protein
MALRYPKDQGTEWMKLRKDVKNAFTSANSRVPYQKIAAGVLKISNSLQVLAGAFMRFSYIDQTDGIYMGSNIMFTGEATEGIYIRRNNGSTAFTSLTRVSDHYGFTGIWDKGGQIVLSDDANSGGLARPWIPHTFATTTELTVPPSTRQTASTTDVTLVNTITYLQHPRMVMWAYVYIQTGGSTAEVKVKDVTAGTTLWTGTSSGGYINPTFDIPGDFGDSHQIDITVRRASGSNNVGITVLSLHGRQS